MHYVYIAVLVIVIWTLIAYANGKNKQREVIGSVVLAAALAGNEHHPWRKDLKVLTFIVWTARLLIVLTAVTLYKVLTNP